MSANSNSCGPTPIVSGLGEIAAAYSVIFCDVWGVIHNGRRHFGAACDALARFRAEQKGVVILVTNAPRPNQPVREQLDGLGVPSQTYDDIVTSGDVTLALIAAHGSAPLHHIGPPRDHALFTILQQQTGVNPPRVGLDAAEYVVCTGLFDDAVETPEDYDAALKVMRSRGMEFISANPDHVVHVGDKLLYCSGAIASRYEEMGGRVLQAGKPYAPIYERAAALAREHCGAGIDKARILAIGDGMRTDVKGAVNFGLDALFVTGGIHQDDVGSESQIDPARLAAFLKSENSRPRAAVNVLRW